MNTIATNIAQPSVSMQSHDNKTAEKQKVSGFGPALLGGIGYLGTKLILPTPPSIIISNKMQKYANLSADEIQILHDAAIKVVEKEGLKDKGVRIKFLNPKNININETVQNLSEKIKNIPINDKTDITWVKNCRKELNNLFEYISKIGTIRNGFNACFFNKDMKVKSLIDKTKKVYIKKNSILMPKNNLAAGAFHEIGHALNYNMSKFGKFLQKCRPVSLMLPAVLAIYGIFTRKSNDKDGKELNKRQKTKNFLRDNVGIISLTAGIPMLLEEGLATIKGNKIAKEMLDSKLSGRVIKGNRIAYLSYITAVVTMAIAAKVGISIKDSRIKHKEQKRQEKIEKENSTQNT